MKKKKCNFVKNNVLRYQAVSASGISLVEELLFLLFILTKTKRFIDNDKLSCRALFKTKLEGTLQDKKMVDKQ